MSFGACVHSTRSSLRGLFLLCLLAGTSSLHTTKPCAAPSTPRGHWLEAKKLLRNRECKVISITADSLKSRLEVLRTQWASDAERAPRTVNIDIRRRIKASRAADDCLEVARAVCPSSDESMQASCARALQEISRDFSSLGDTPDVFLRVVCDSSYEARCPQMHTDKVPIRGIVTIQGEGTEYIFPKDSGAIRQASDLEFLVLKGDKYSSIEPWASVFQLPLTSAEGVLHRSPALRPNEPQRRVLVTLDLDSGHDDREWLLRRPAS